MNFELLRGRDRNRYFQQKFRSDLDLNLSITTKIQCSRAGHNSHGPCLWININLVLRNTRGSKRINTLMVELVSFRIPSLCRQSRSKWNAYIKCWLRFNIVYLIKLWARNSSTSDSWWATKSCIVLSRKLCLSCSSGVSCGDWSDS